MERIRVLADVLEIRDGGLVKIARDISQDGSLLDLEYMRPEDAAELESFLVAVLQAEKRAVGAEVYV